MQFRAPNLPDREKSESAIIVDLCLSRLREEAGLDDELALPPLQRITDHVVATAPPRRITPLPLLPKLAPEPLVPESVPMLAAKPVPRRRRWPLLLLTFLVGVCGGSALMMSPVGQRPDVQQVLSMAKASLARVMH